MNLIEVHSAVGIFKVSVTGHIVKVDNMCQDEQVAHQYEDVVRFDFAEYNRRAGRQFWERDTHYKIVDLDLVLDSGAVLPASSKWRAGLEEEKEN